MLKAICKLLMAILIGWFLVWATYKIGIGLDYWLPFIGVVVGLLGGVIGTVVKRKAKSAD